MGTITGEHEPYRLDAFEISHTDDGELVMKLKSTPDPTDGGEPGLVSYWVVDRATAADVAGRLHSMPTSSSISHAHAHTDAHTDTPSFAVQQIRD